MAGLKLDGAGIAKMKTLEDAMNMLQRIHGLVEQWAMAEKRNMPSSHYSSNIRRSMPVLASTLKAQFGLISDQVMQTNLASSRGAADGPKIRTLREGVAQVRQALEIAITRTKDLHSADDKKKEQPASTD
jgi:hypothetical protein